MNEKPITPTCGNCGKPMKTNVPRLGPAGGWVHSDTGQLKCSISAPAPPPEAAGEMPRTDAASFREDVGPGSHVEWEDHVLATFARSLEKRLNVATSKLAELTKEREDSRLGPVAMKLAESQAEAHELSHKLTAKTLEADGLRSALEQIYALPAGGVTWIHMRNISKFALASADDSGGKQ